jgi:type IV pilus assembly protein PilY1
MAKKIHTIFLTGMLVLAMLGVIAPPASALPTSADYAAIPPFISAGSPPLVLLVLGRDHKLYYEAYNDAGDLDGDGLLDVGFKPNIDYYGYFDSYKCYLYNSANERFEPSRTTSDGKCGGSGEWSGNFLNYITMSRMDALRKVLYGGYRYVDTATETVLERAYVPRDAHTWGKEFYTIAHDGYDLREYAPFELPETGKRHFFACTSLYDPSDSRYRPLLRVLPNVGNGNRIWNWVAKERPVADNSLDDPGSSRYEDYPSNAEEFAWMVDKFANWSHKYPGAGNGSTVPPGGKIAVYDNAADFPAAPGTYYEDGNPFDGALPTDDDDYYLNIITGTIYIPSGQAGTYTFAVDGDDALELIIDGTVVTGWYGAHSWSQSTTHNGSIYLGAGGHIIEFRHQERTGNDSYFLYWNGPASGSVWEIVPETAFESSPGNNTLRQTTYTVTGLSTKIIDYTVRIQVGVSTMPESNCKLYPNGTYKPTGILQKHGESDSMYFGLLTGSYTKNTSGGVLRKKMSSITDEIDPTTGQLTAVNGIMRNIDRLRVRGYSYSSYSHNSNCGWIATRAINAGECRMWGNPIAEMMYEGMRYYSGAGTPTAEFTYSGTSNDDYALGLAKPSWDDPFDEATGYASCSKPFMMVISDISPSFDTDQLPGTYFGTFSGSLGTLNVGTITDGIGTLEGISGDYFIGETDPNDPTNFDTTCSPKTGAQFGKFRGLCPEEPTKRGGYYSAAVAYYAHNTDINATAKGEQRVTTYTVGLSSPLPRIEIQVGDQAITLVPFAKSVGGYGISTSKYAFQPTNTIVDFFVESWSPTAGKFVINYEDVEQGADHDMDAIVEYTFQVYKTGDIPVTDPAEGEYVKITLDSTYAAGSIIQHMGYIISGTDGKDGTYLEVRDKDTGQSSDPEYFLDTPPGRDPGEGHAGSGSGAYLPLTAERTFYPKATAASPAQLLNNPLWYAAKYGGFEDLNSNSIPDQQSEWDKDNDGNPDTYFYIVNPLKMEEKLNQSFASILERVSSGTAASVISGSRTGEGALYQALFYPKSSDPSGNELAWSGKIYSLFVDTYGNFREDTNTNAVLELNQDRIVQLYFDPIENRTRVRFYVDSDGDGLADGAPLIGEMDDLSPIWDGSVWLAEATATANRALASTNKSRRIWTWVDLDESGTVTDDGKIDGTETAGSETILFDPALTTTRSVLAPYLMARAVLTTSMAGDNNDLEFTAIQPGITGGAVTIEFVITGANYPDTTVSVTGTDIQVQLATNAVGSSVSTAAQVASVINNNAQSSALVTARLIEDASGLGAVSTLTKTQLSLDDGVKKLMEYAIGIDQQNWRKRSFTVNGTVRTWKMGDIVSSTPSVVGQPAEDYDLIYGDASFFNFRRAHAGRRQVIYFGTNDGFLHAINGGFWDRDNRRFVKTRSTYKVEWDDTDKEYDIKFAEPTYDPTPYDLGAEMWSFIPQSILPHLQWLKEKDYPHVYMVDLKPRVVDIKFADGRWRTILICGLRLGGKDIETTDDFNYDGTVGTSPDEKRVFYSEYFALDITDPEAEPELLWSFSHPELGLTTSYPTVVRVKDSWFVIMGSGPNGSQAYGGSSNQNGRIFVLNAETGAMARTSPFVIPEAASFLADPIAVDLDLAAVEESLEIKWTDEIAYIGSTSGSAGSWGGAMYRIKMTNSSGVGDEDPNNWVLSTMITANGPISSAPNASRDVAGNLWVFFGTGRFWSTADKAECYAYCYPDTTTADCQTCQENSKQWFYGVYEPRDAATGVPTYATLTHAGLVNTTGYAVYTDGGVDTSGDGTPDTTFTDLIYGSTDKNGWYFRFEDVGERSLFQPIVLGGIVTFTTYIPSLDVCEYEGTSNLYAIYYLTGTAFNRSVIGTDPSQTTPGGGELVLGKTSLGTGVGTAPSIHLGADSKVMVQSSTGAIITVTEETATEVRSGLKGWKEEY